MTQILSHMSPTQLAECAGKNDKKNCLRFRTNSVDFFNK